MQACWFSSQHERPKQLCRLANVQGKFIHQGSGQLFPLKNNHYHFHPNHSYKWNHFQGSAGSDSKHQWRLVWHRRRHGGHVIQLSCSNNKSLRESKSEIGSFGTCTGCCVWCNCCACCTAWIDQPARYSLSTAILFTIQISCVVHTSDKTMRFEQAISSLSMKMSIHWQGDCWWKVYIYKIYLSSRRGEIFFWFTF